jgi:multidrug efflux pump subunit AcrB
MAFLGIVSLVGVIVSHVIVLFDFIEEKHAAGEPLEEAVLDAGIIRLRPVMITVGATIFGLIPLALHGGRSGSPCATPRSAACWWLPSLPYSWCRCFTASLCWT